ncbi:pyridoxamine 5'-phosphate oxidase family protein [Kineococcus arenarius]|uniref:pyridoxamine 5'-phosphate oxidase family protein n=1 Tax=Kineococcus sp. SYSU DK007 TaxID=3383128 RepID=UPI003D7D7DDF
MSAAAPVPGVEVLDERTCWELLRQAPYGRFVVVDADGRPDVFPVNHAVDHGSVLFRTADGGKLAAVASGSPVAFEVDGVSGDLAWSVVLRGVAHQVTRMAELLDTASVHLAPWQAGGKGRFVRVRGDLSGRRFPVTGSGWWAVGPAGPGAPA